MMEGKKISFGFMKTKKVEKQAEEKKEFIECMEDKSLKIVGGEEVKEVAPLVIPLKPNTLVTAERLKQIAAEVESVLNDPEPGEKRPSPPPQPVPANETLDQMVVRELLQESKKDVKTDSAILTVTIPAKSVMDGQKESTLEDYEDVPIQEFGMAMLRGMGWAPNQEQSKYKQPQLRPKGLGLGADKIVTENQKKKMSAKDKDEELSIVKNSYVKITTGKHSGYYGKVVSLDEDNGRVMVDIAVKKETVSLSEFMLHPVTKAEFDKESKVINADSFKEYKRNEISQKPSNSPKEREASSSSKLQDSNNRQSRQDKNENQTSRKDYDNSEGRSKEKHRRDSSSSEDRSRRKKEKKKKKRYSSCDSSSSVSDSEKRRKHKSSKKKYSSDSDSDSPREKRKVEKKRDIDKKRKGKKKKRDRDRSPNYKKYRK